MATTNVRRQNSGRPVRPEALTLDPIHEAAVENAMILDRGHAEAGERSWRRLALPHEMCEPFGICSPSWPLLVDVLVLDDGIRLRAPVPGDGAAA